MVPLNFMTTGKADYIVTGNFSNLAAKEDVYKRQLLDGANQLDSGLGQLTEGLDTLTSNNAALTSGAQQVADGVLDSANQTLMENGLIDTPMTWDTYEAVIDDILSLGDKTLAAGRKKMVRTIWEQAPQFLSLIHI